MIKKLRRKFIAAAMCSVAVVLGAIILVINIANYHNVKQNAEQTIQMIADNGGRFPGSENIGDIDMRPDGMQPSSDRRDISDIEKTKRFRDMNISPEAPFSTRYFTVTISHNGEVGETDIGRIAAVSSETAGDIAAKLFDTGKTEGFYGSYRYKAETVENGMMYVFLDCSQELSTFYSFLAASVLVSLGGLVLVFAMVVLISGIVLKPAAESISKQKRFITDAGHEIKTPLTIIDANTEVLELENGGNEWTQSIRNQVKRLTSMTEKLVFLSRMDEEAKVRFCEFQASQAVEETASAFEPVASAKGKDLKINVEENLILNGDETMVRQLVSILLDNAVKYSDEGGRISLTFKASGKSRILETVNTVEEVRQGKLDEFFERFYRADGSRSSDTGGCGIGLSVAWEIVNAHGGKISAKSDDGRSVRITAVL